MKNSKLFIRTLLCLLLALSLLVLCGCNENELVDVQPASEEPAPEEPEVPAYDGPQGYIDCAPCGDGFVAVGTCGRVDLIALDGTVTNCETGTTAKLNSVFVEGSNIAVAGDGGTLLISNDGGATFRQEGPKKAGNLNGAVVYQGNLYTAGQGGIIYRKNGSSWDEIPTEAGTDLIGLDIMQDRIIAVSANTDVYLSEDGEDWDYMNFNEVYKGLYPEYTFTRLVGAGGTFFVLGYPNENPTYPLIMYTTYADVWMQREMMMINGEYVSADMKLPIYDICFNIDQIVGVTDNGVVVAITDCTKCNETHQLDTDKSLWTTAVREEGVLVAGQDYYCTVLDSKQIRQDKIAAEQAYDDIYYGGAYLIDVREDDELIADGYIPGSIHIPLAEVEERLAEVVPDYYDEIIFYCASGKRSQTATEKAVEMGYQSVYNLGGLSDWPYDIEFPEGAPEEVPEETAEEPAE